MFTADAHCDTLYNQAVHHYKPEDCVVTIDRLRDGNVGLQTFAMFTSFRRPDPYADGVAMKELYKTLPIPHLDGKLPDLPPPSPAPYSPARAAKCCRAVWIVWQNLTMMYTCA